ncbi:hypothetical protein G7B21_29250, partial [Klebsiella pneumoniae]|nr:hypothetical protein [Klebsiella pneumoniae]
MQEETEQTEAGVRFIAPVKAGQHIRRRGEDDARRCRRLRCGVMQEETEQTEAGVRFIAPVKA